MPFTYVLYSTKVDKYYTGVCQENLKHRIHQHNSAAYGSNSYTAISSDWKLFLSIQVASITHALRLERKIKAMKSRVFIQNLKKYPDLRKKIIQATRDK